MSQTNITVVFKYISNTGRSTDE